MQYTSSRKNIDSNVRRMLLRFPGVVLLDVETIRGDTWSRHHSVANWSRNQTIAIKGSYFSWYFFIISKYTNFIICKREREGDPSREEPRERCARLSRERGVNHLAHPCTKDTILLLVNVMSDSTKPSKNEKTSVRGGKRESKEKSANVHVHNKLYKRINWFSKFPQHDS